MPILQNMTHTHTLTYTHTATAVLTIPSDAKSISFCPVSSPAQPLYLPLLPIVLVTFSKVNASLTGEGQCRISAWLSDTQTPPSSDSETSCHPFSGGKT